MTLCSWKLFLNCFVVAGGERSLGVLGDTARPSRSRNRTAGETQHPASPQPAPSQPPGCRTALPVPQETGQTQGAALLWLVVLSPRGWGCSWAATQRQDQEGHVGGEVTWELQLFPRERRAREVLPLHPSGCPRFLAVDAPVLDGVAPHLRPCRPCLQPAATRSPCEGPAVPGGRGRFHPWCCLGERAAGDKERKEESSWEVAAEQRRKKHKSFLFA